MNAATSLDESDQTGGRRWRRRDKAPVPAGPTEPAAPAAPLLSPEEYAARLGEAQAAAEQATQLRRSAELAAAEASAERLVAEDAAREAIAVYSRLGFRHDEVDTHVQYRRG